MITTITTDPTNGRPSPRPRAAFAMRDGLLPRLFSAHQLEAIGELLDVDPSPGAVLDSFDPANTALAEIEVLITGWECPAITPEALDAMPKLRAVLHAAGTVKPHVSPEAWHRGILVTSAATANAFPVAEYTLAMILLAGKGAPRITAAYAADGNLDLERRFPEIGNFHRRVGILGASKVGRRVIELLQPFDLDLTVSDPFLQDDDPLLRLARRVELDELFRTSDVLSVHAPLLPSTVGLVDRALIDSLPPGATLINTARAPIVDQDAVEDAVRAGRLTAILDVTDPEPLPVDHPLRRLPGVVITPHLAGALGNELHRLGESVLDEVRHLVRGEAPLHPVNLLDLAATA